MTDEEFVTLYDEAFWNSNAFMISGYFLTDFPYNYLIDGSRGTILKDGATCSDTILQSQTAVVYDPPTDNNCLFENPGSDGDITEASFRCKKFLYESQIG